MVEEIYGIDNHMGKNKVSDLYELTRSTEY